MEIHHIIILIADLVLLGVDLYVLKMLFKED